MTVNIPIDGQVCSFNWDIAIERDFPGEYDLEWNMIEDMKLTKDEATKRVKSTLNRKRAWEEKFEAKYADVTNLYTTA